MRVTSVPSPFPTGGERRGLERRQAAAAGIEHVERRGGVARAPKAQGAVGGVGESHDRFAADRSGPEALDECLEPRDLLRNAQRLVFDAARIVGERVAEERAEVL